MVMQSQEKQCKNYEDIQAELTQLQRENFQLKLRIHLTETRGVADPITSTTPKRTIKDIETDKECQILKVEKEQLEIKLRQKESLLLHEIKQKNEIVNREAILLEKYSELKNQLELLEREKSVSRLRQVPQTDSSIILTPISKSAVKLSTSGKQSSSSLTLGDHQREVQEWFEKYEAERKKCLEMNTELSHVREELEKENNERQVLLIQLKKSEDGRKKEAIVMKNRHQEMRTALDKADERAEALRKRAMLDMSKQLYHHQTALEKVHKEQGLLIAELQTLKKSCPFKIQNALKLCDEIDEDYGETDVVPTKHTGVDDLSHPVSLARGVNEPERMSRKDSNGKINVVEDYKENAAVDVNGNSVVKVDRSYEDSISHVNRKLHEKNSKLALKLKKTREGMRACISMLEYSEKDKAGMEKIICRQLHKTHTILAEVKETLTHSRGVPSSVPNASTPMNYNDNHESFLALTSSVN